MPNHHPYFLFTVPLLSCTTTLPILCATKLPTRPTNPAIGTTLRIFTQYSAPPAAPSQNPTHTQAPATAPLSING